MPDSIARLAGQMAVRHGLHGEAIARTLLDQHGVRSLWRIETGWRIHRVNGRIVGANPLRAVPGDWRGIMPGGRSVICEVKERPERLIWSDLEAHQHAALQEHADLGGLSLLAWVSKHRAFLLPYPCPTLAPRQQGLTTTAGIFHALRTLELR